MEDVVTRWKEMVPIKTEEAEGEDGCWAQVEAGGPFIQYALSVSSLLRIGEA